MWCLCRIYKFPCFPCLWLDLHVLCSYAYVHVSHMLVCLSLHSPMPLFLYPHAQMYIYMFTCMLLCLYVQIYVFTYLCAQVFFSICSMLFLTLDQYACLLLAMFMCLGLGFVCHVMCYCSPFVPFITSSCVLAYWFGLDLDLMVFVIVHTPRSTSKDLDHLICMSMLACFYALCLCQPFLSQAFPCLMPSASLNLVWLHPTPIRPYLDMTIWVASPNAGLPHAYPSLFRSMRCYAYHVCSRHPLAFYASLHGCSHVHA